MMMIRIIFSTIAIAMALTLILTATTKSMEDTPRPSKPAFLERKPAPARRVSRFLEQNGPRNSTAADHCSKDNEICSSILPSGRNATCCNNKCVDLGFDSDNCGACKNKCAFTETCCRGECVDLAYDKRHCGSCNNKCMESGHCIYGLCDYA